MNIIQRINKQKGKEIPHRLSIPENTIDAYIDSRLKIKELVEQQKVKEIIDNQVKEEVEKQIKDIFK